MKISYSYCTKPLFWLIGLSVTFFFPLLAGAQTPGSPSPQGSAPLQSEWVTKPGEDAMTGAPSIDTWKQFRAGGDAFVDVSASCHIDPIAQKADAAPSPAAVVQGMMDSIGAPIAPRVDTQKKRHLDTRTLEFQFRYQAASSGPSLLLRPETFSTTSCVHMRVTVDGMGKSDVQSDICNVPNRASIHFRALHMHDLMPSLGSLSPELGDTSNPLGKLLGGTNNATLDQFDIALMQEAIGSQEIRVELPLSDGNAIVVRIHPQEPGFRQFVSRCRATFPDPPKPEIVVSRGGPLGVRVEPTTLQLRSRRIQGLKVLYIYPNSPAFYVPMRMGDVIATINGNPVTSEEDIIRILAGGNSNRVGVNVYRDGQLLGFIMEPQ